MEVAPFFVHFHHFLSIFTIFYRFSRFTHFCRDLRTFSANFFWPNEPSPQHHTFFACMIVQELLCNKSVPESWARESQENMQGSRNSRCSCRYIVDQPVRFLAVVLLLTSLLGFWRSSLRETQRTWYAEPRMRWGPTGRIQTTLLSEEINWIPLAN